MTRRAHKRAPVPRSILILSAVAVLVVGALWLARRNESIDYTLGGALFPVEPDRIEGLLLTRQGTQHRFNRQKDGVWSLSGATSDYLDPQAMSALIEVLPTVVGGALLPGTVNEDRRYDFNGPGAIRLRVFLSGGKDIALALGAINPVTGNYFASGAGRQGCFPVAGPFREKLSMLPISVQAKTLLPPFTRDKVQALRLTRSGSEHRFVRHDRKWWLHLPDEDLAAALQGLPPVVQEYQARYSDRRRRDAEGLWIMASEQAVGQLIYEVSEIIVRDIKSPAEAAARLSQWDLDPPWRQVVLQGEGLNADPAAPVKDQFTIAFGPPVDEIRVPVLRRGNVLLTDLDALNLLDQGLAVLVEQFALNEVARHADRLRVEREERPVLDATRTGEAETDEGRRAWETIFPGPGREDLTNNERHGLSRNLVVNLNRVKVLAALPPTSNAAVLEDRERVRMRLVWGTGEQARELVLESGYLAAAHLPPGTGELRRMPAGGPAVGLWFPATGKLLQIGDQLVVTVRNMVRYSRPLHSP